MTPMGKCLHGRKECYSLSKSKVWTERAVCPQCVPGYWKPPPHWVIDGTRAHGRRDCPGIDLDDYIVERASCKICM